MSIIIACLTSPSPFPSLLCVSFLSDPFSVCPSGSGGNSHSSTQMNSYSDSGYQDTSSGYVSSQNVGKAELRMQHSFPGACTGTLVRNARAEGQASAQVLPTASHATHRCCCRARNASAKGVFYLKLLKHMHHVTLLSFKSRSRQSPRQLVGATSAGREG